MKLHANAKLTPQGRALLVERVRQQGWAVADAARAAGVSVRTVYRWLARYRTEGPQGLVDRSSAAHRLPAATPQDRVRAILALRGLRMTGAQIAESLGMPVSTVSGILAASERWLSRMVVRCRPRITPHIPLVRIGLATRSRPTSTPRSVNSRPVRRCP